MISRALWEFLHGGPELTAEDEAGLLSQYDFMQKMAQKDYEILLPDILELIDNEIDRLSSQVVCPATCTVQTLELFDLLAMIRQLGIFIASNITEVSYLNMEYMFFNPITDLIKAMDQFNRLLRLLLATGPDRGNKVEWESILPTPQDVIEEYKDYLDFRESRVPYEVVWTLVDFHMEITHCGTNRSMDFKPWAIVENRHSFDESVTSKIEIEYRKLDSIIREQGLESSHTWLVNLADEEFREANFVAIKKIIRRASKLQKVFPGLSLRKVISIVMDYCMSKLPKLIRDHRQAFSTDQVEKRPFSLLTIMRVLRNKVVGRGHCKISSYAENLRERSKNAEA